MVAVLRPRVSVIHSRPGLKRDVVRDSARDGLGMAGYMFDPKLPLFVRGLSLFHGWLPFLLLHRTPDPAGSIARP